jgi:hypothetical protein
MLIRGNPTKLGSLLVRPMDHCPCKKAGAIPKVYLVRNSWKMDYIGCSAGTGYYLLRMGT